MTAAVSVVSVVFSVRLIDNFDADMSQARSGTHVSTKLEGRRSGTLASELCKHAGQRRHTSPAWSLTEVHTKMLLRIAGRMISSI
jgi:hypothetical protein